MCVYWWPLAITLSCLAFLNNDICALTKIDRHFKPQGPVQFYIISYPLPLYSKTDKGAIGSNTCHLPEAVNSVSHVRMTNNLHHFVQK